MVQVPLIASVPPEREIVRGEVVVRVPPLQADEEEDETVKPVGKTSVNETPVRELPVLGLVSVNVSVLVLPVPMEVGEKLLERFGTVGRVQPVKVTSSMWNSALVFCAPTALMRNVVVLVPVVGAAYVIPYVPTVVVCHEPLEVEKPGLEVNAPESARL